MVAGQIESLISMSDRASEQLEFWREYKGEEILIRKHEIERTKEERNGPDLKKIKQTSYIIRGEIEEVMSFPPGFRLKDVVENVVSDDYAVVHGDSVTDLLSGENETYGVREIDRKFVSFDAIEELEWAEDADNAVMPFHDKQRVEE